MISPLFRNIVRFALLIALQLFVLNGMNMGGYINPYVYLLFILLLPAEMNRNTVLILGFVTGMTIDIFGNTPGLHTAATVAMAYFRPGVLRLFFPQAEFGVNDEPTPTRLGLGGFLRYSIVLVFIHHMVLFMLEAMSLNHFFRTMLSVLLSELATIVMILILVMFFSRRKV